MLFNVVNFLFVGIKSKINLIPFVISLLPCVFDFGACVAQLLTLLSRFEFVFVLPLYYFCLQTVNAVFSTTWNFAFGMLDTITAISMALEAVVFIVMAIYSGKASAESKSVKSNEV